MSDELDAAATGIHALTGTGWLTTGPRSFSNEDLARAAITAYLAELPQHTFGATTVTVVEDSDVQQLRAALATAKGERDAAVAVCEAAERFERKTKISFRMDGYRYSSADIAPLRDALTTWRATLEAPHA